MAITTKKVNQLDSVGTIASGDVLVGERVNGTTVRMTFTGIPLVDGDKGDITVSSSGTVWTVDNDVVTYAKMQNVSATDKLLGRSSSGAGDVEEIACTAAGRALIDDADAATQRTTLGLGTLATQNGTFSGTSSGTNTGDQSSIVGITGTKAQFDTAVTDGNILYVGDVTQYTDEMAQDAVGAMVDASLTYVDATPLLQRAALTGDVTASAGSNATTVVLPSSATVATDDKVYIFDTSASDAKKYVTAQSIADLGPQAAAQADQETATSTSTYVSPGRQQYHPSAAKLWCYATVSAGTPSIAASYNITSVTDGGVGLITFNHTVNMSSANYATVIGNSVTGTVVDNVTYVTSRGTTGTSASHYETSLTDPPVWEIVGYGDQ